MNVREGGTRFAPQHTATHCKERKNSLDQLEVVNRPIVNRPPKTRSFAINTCQMLFEGCRRFVAVVQCDVCRSMLQCAVVCDIVL